LPNWADAGRRLRAALDTIGRDDVEVHFQAVETAEEAAAVAFWRSHGRRPGRELDERIGR
jgi:hypothetical protein